MSASIIESKQNPSSTRLASMDAYRGFVMVCLAANGFGLSKSVEIFPDSSFWQSVGYQFQHVEWLGCAFWDLIQPSFMFLVGVALPYSYARREASGDDSLKQFGHVLIRSLVLILLGIFLSSGGQPTTNFTFMNVLTQIGLGYPFLYLLRNRGLLIQIAAAILILTSYWGWFAVTSPTPIETLESESIPVNVGQLEGFESHWAKHRGAAAQFDRWFLNCFPAANQPATQSASNAPNQAEPAPETIKTAPTGIRRIKDAVLRRLFTRPTPYVFNGGGYQTLNFIPSIVTMLIGLMAGEFIRRTGSNHRRIVGTLIVAGLILLALGWIWQASGMCPLVKRIWTPSWTLFSTGWTILMLAGFYGIVDGLGWKYWAFPLVVAGMNSMVLYMSGQLLRGWTSDLLKRHINENLYTIFGSRYAPIVEANLVLLCFWLFVYWLYRQRIFVKI